MARIKKIQENGVTIYPVTIPQAIKDPTTNKTFTEILNQYVPLSGNSIINGGLTAKGFTVEGYGNNYVLISAGPPKPLSDFALQNTAASFTKLTVGDVTSNGIVGFTGPTYLNGQTYNKQGIKFDNKPVDEDPKFWLDTGERKSIKELNIATEKGKYPELISGYTYEIIGDGQATEEEFSYRPTAGEDRNVATTKIYDDDIKYGAAQIKTLKGNSVVWNQKGVLRQTDATPRTVNGITLTIEGDDLVFNGTASELAVFNLIDVKHLVKGHKYYVDWRTNYVDGSWYNYCIYIPNSYWTDAEGTHSGSPFIKEAIISINVDTATFTVWAGKTVQNIRISTKPLFVDLTQMFGAGSEPTTVEEFYQRLPIIEDINAYNEGKIVDGNYGAVKTTGVNQYNGTFAKVIGGLTYYLGGTYTSVGFTTSEGGATEVISISSNKLYTPTQNGYIYAQGSDICISLVWPEYGEFKDYEPYKPYVRDLSWVNNYFPATINGVTQYGMRSAGSVRDEIRFNSTTQKWEAVQRVGVRAYTSGDESDTAVTTDGKNTNYALATPDVKEITENINLVYDVSDLGTEELLVLEGNQSAPLVADIVYEPNVLASSKQIPDILKRLASLEAAIATMQTSAVAMTNEE